MILSFVLQRLALVNVCVRCHALARFNSHLFNQMNMSQFQVIICRVDDVLQATAIIAFMKYFGM